MLPRGEQLLNRNRSFQKKSASETTDSSEKDHTNHDTVNNDTDANMMVAGSHLIVLQFLKSGFVNNPVIVSKRAHELYLLCVAIIVKCTLILS